MARKRDYAEDALPQQPAFKRQCALSSPQRARDALADAGATFLQAFGSACGPGATGVNDLVWQCFSELNVLLRHNSVQLRDVPLAGYTSLTRCPKAAAFDKLLFAEQLQPNQLHQRCPPHVQAISVMLRRYFGGHDEASLCRYTVPTQDWMMQWCNKWGFSGRQISLWTVNAYSSQGRPHQVCGALSSQVCEPRNVHGVELVAGVDSLHSTLFCPIIPL